MRRTVVVIGGGATGVSALLHIAPLPQVARVDVVDPRPPGLGPAFGDPDPALLCNTSLDVTSLRPDGPSDLLTYLGVRGWPVANGTFVPRFLVGQYCRERYLWARDRAAERGATVAHVRDRAEAVRSTGGGYRVELASGASLVASDVLVCAGLSTPRPPDLVRPHLGHEALSESPYPVARLRGLPADARVLVLGTGLSAIDAALVLCSGGRRVTMASPSGRLPAVRTRLTRPERSRLDLSCLGTPGVAPTDRDPAVLRSLVSALAKVAPGLPLRHQVAAGGDPVARLREETELAERGLTAWQDLVSEVIDQVNEHTVDWPPHERSALLARYREAVFRYVSAIPLANARALVGHCDDGLLSVADGSPTRLDRAGDRWRVRWRSGAEDFDHVVCATGLREPRLRVDPPDTLRLESGGAEPTDEERPLVTERLRVRLAADRPEERIWLLGSTSRPRTAIPNYLREAAAHARAVADQWAATPPPLTQEEPDDRSRQPRLVRTGPLVGVPGGGG
ncbi:FAD/NAD(P)-binding protein [Nocardiopsis sp. FIRDI 009]|uniref:FAD/NAD(P)-binding protein n=1 Tax=Nocardiopsis sp. FIRDI 009 TaxID=714197 RepID=UPI0018E591CC|nr:FAD/NAD(P)-binding protein [Nocardiopsis sp. FIRDI 009]